MCAQTSLQTDSYKRYNMRYLLHVHSYTLGMLFVENSFLLS